MKAWPLLVQWHNGQTPIYSAHFQPHGKCRLATGGGDNNVRLWKLESSGTDVPSVTYLSTLSKHTQAVNVVRWCPTKDEILASAGDDGNVLLWVPAERHESIAAFGSDQTENKETWRVRHMCRSMGSEIYDLAWSPDGMFFITGSMDNIVRIYNAHDGSMVRQIAEHNHYVQGVAWDPLNEYIATQSADRSVHIYSLKTKDGQFSLTQFNKISKMDLPARGSVSSSYSPTPPDLSRRGTDRDGSAVSSTPGTPSANRINPNIPVGSSGYPYALGHSRRSSHSSSRRSVSPPPSFPLPAVMPSVSPSFHPTLIRNAHIYANETFASFFRRLSFSPDGSLLFTPAGQYKLSHPNLDPNRVSDEILNTVYIYTRAGLNRPPIAYLPGHKKASIAVKCSPILYEHRQSAPLPTWNITMDTSSGDGDIPPLPEPAFPLKPPTPFSLDGRPSNTFSLQPRTFTANVVSTVPLPGSATDPEPPTVTTSDPDAPAPPAGSAPTPVFSLPYRMVYAVAAHDTVYVYDTQQRKPLCVVSNLHYSAFTDLAWTPDGTTLLISSSDGFCSTLIFDSDQLGTPYTGPIPTHTRPTPAPPVSSLVPLPGPPSGQPSIATLFPGMVGSGPSRVHTSMMPASGSASVQARQSRPSTPSTTVSTNSSKGGKDGRDVTAPLSPMTSVSTSATDPCVLPQQQQQHLTAWMPHQLGHGLGPTVETAVIPVSATPTIANLPSVTATQSGSSLGSLSAQGGLGCGGGGSVSGSGTSSTVTAVGGGNGNGNASSTSVNVMPTPGSHQSLNTTPPMTPRRSGGSGGGNVGPSVGAGGMMPPVGSRHRTHSASSSISGFNISSLPAPPLFQADSSGGGGSGAASVVGAASAASAPAATTAPPAATITTSTTMTTTTASVPAPAPAPVSTTSAAAQRIEAPFRSHSEGGRGGDAGGHHRHHHYAHEGVLPTTGAASVSGLKRGSDAMLSGADPDKLIAAAAASVAESTGMAPAVPAVAGGAAIGGAGGNGAGGGSADAGVIVDSVETVVGGGERADAAPKGDVTAQVRPEGQAEAQVEPVVAPKPGSGANVSQPAGDGSEPGESGAGSGAASAEVDADAEAGTDTQPAAKRRRVAPTVVDEGANA